MIGGLFLAGAQLLAILAATRLCAAAARRAGQPPVMGEIVGGLLLGPSFLGWLWPGPQALLFPPDSLPPLKSLSQAGLILFMFAVGARLDVRGLARRTREAAWISAAGILLPFALGLALAARLHASRSPAGVGIAPFALFLATAMSVTAFPVLARIIHDRGLGGTRLGALALSCAAADDAAAWCLLAATAAIARGTAGWGLARALLGGLLYAGAMLLAARPLLGALGSRRLSPVSRAAAALAAAFLSAWASDAAGLHALFGAFLAGLLWPERLGEGRSPWPRLEAVSRSLLLPVFFALTGLRVSVRLISGPAAWLDLSLILAAAVAGKLGGTGLAARAAGRPWREALALGALMNTRGLVELAVLGAGLELGVIGPDLFAMMVLMALATTFMAGPLLELVEYQEDRADHEREARQVVPAQPLA